MTSIWFKRKQHGWGWDPISWQAWLVLLVWIIIFTYLTATIEHNWFKNIVLIVLSIAVLIFIAYKKGEKPRWQ
jgi:uncharacterized membrane protein YdjX (TVP38/TMEM64 family)